MLVVGCKGVGANTDDIEGNKYQKTWNSQNTSRDKFVRTYQQFGSRDVTYALIEVTATYPDNGWTGVNFGITKTGKKNDKNEDIINFYNLALRKSQGKLYYYLSYFSNVDPSNIESADSFGSEQYIIATDSGAGTELPSKFGLSTAEDGSLKFYVKLELTENGNAVAVKLGKAEDSMEPVGTYTTSTYNPAVENAKGGIGLYAQISKATEANPTLPAKASWEVIESDPSRTLLAAEDAE